MSYFEKAKRNFGFGCMRLPMDGENVDLKETARMVDAFIENGFNYFDTAHGYLSGKSELAVRECLTSRYPREDYVLTNKLTGTYFDKEEDIRPFFESQLKACGVEYFDFYLMHAQTGVLFKKFCKCRAYETAFELKKEGKIRHVGLSFHDTAEVLEEILTAYPEVEVVQLQLNYADWNDPAVQSRKCYEVCRKHSKPVIVMEPVKGGTLVNLPEQAKKVLDEAGTGSYAGYAIRFAAGFDGVFMVLSGMSNMEQMLDNISYMKQFTPLNAAERAAVEKVCEIIHSKQLIPCTACRYCTDGCPKRISIPDLFACMNAKQLYKDWNAEYYYGIYTTKFGKPEDCIKCGKCEKVCPQHLAIRDLLKSVYEQFKDSQEND
ncbi:MAG: aldo/keto reductase [Candidatus Neoclostridium sp.]